MRGASLGDAIQVPHAYLRGKAKPHNDLMNDLVCANCGLVGDVV